MEFPEIVKLPKKLEVKAVEVDPARTALVIVDVQNDFVRSSGKLHAKGAEKIIQPIRDLISKARSSGAAVIFTQDWHVKGDPEFDIWGEHTVANSWGAEIVDELEPSDSDIVVRKPSYDAFYSTPLDHILRAKKIENLILTGLLGNICVLCTAIGAAVRGYKIVVPVDAVFTILEFDHVASLRFMTSILKATLTTSQLLRFEVEKK